MYKVHKLSAAVSMKSLWCKSDAINLTTDFLDTASYNIV